MILTVHDPIPHSTDESKHIERKRKFNFLLIKNILLLNSNQKEEFVTRYKLHNHNVFASKLGPYDYLHIYDNHNQKPDDYILFFGRIDKYKGLEYLFEAMKILHTQGNLIKLIVAGSGSFWFDIDKYKDCSITIYNRYIPDDELSNLIRNCKFVVCPYIDATQSGVIMSAYAYSKPVIATNVGGLPEMVDNNINGLIVEPKDGNALSDAILKLMDSQLLAAYSKSLSLKYQDGENSWKGIAAEIGKVYHNMNI